ncbi:MAG: oxidoreductase [Planctomycetes bacterium]|nr:oxidoreductase [Planctomycetota bacterium]
MGTAGSSSPLELREFIVKEHVGLLKLTDTYDIFNPQTQQQVALAREAIGDGMKFLRLLVNKQMMPTTVRVTERDENGPLLFEIQRGWTFLRAKVMVLDAAGRELGYFKSKLFSLVGGFLVHDMADQLVAEVKGDWKGWNFTFVGPNQQEFGVVTKKWAGVAKELFTSADTYAVSIAPLADAVANSRILLLAAALAIDIVFKEAS